VDANVLIFERVKEELKRGLPKSSAIEEGFRRAWPSIRDSNSSTIITSIILYFFTSSFVQGFALTLLLGTLVSLFSAITTTRLFLRFFLKDKPGDKTGPTPTKV
jgi:preprotein translocase subunit SecD